MWSSNSVEKLWDRGAVKYSELIDGGGTHHECLTPILLNIVCQKEKQVRVLDVGCGEGYLTHRMSICGHKVVGVDISGELIKLAKQKYPQLNFIKASASTISTKVKGRFDIIISNFAVHDMEDGVLKLFLLETKKILKKVAC